MSIQTSYFGGAVLDGGSFASNSSQHVGALLPNIALENLGKVSSLSFTTYSTGNLHVTNWQVSDPSKLCSNSKLSAQEMLCTSKICSIDPFTPSKGVKHLGNSLVHTSSHDCIAVFNSSTSVKHLFHSF